MIINKKRHLEIKLSRIPSIDNPVEELEQYKTPPDIAADISWDIVMNRKIIPRIIIDLGCGTGSLCFSFTFLGAPYCICLDIDEKVISKASDFARAERIIDNVDFILSDVRFLSLRKEISNSIVIMNPPWGTRIKGIDSIFLEKAMELSSMLVSIHALPKDIRKNYIVRLIENNNWKITKTEIRDFPIKASLPHHEKKIYKTKALIVEAIKHGEQR